MSRMNGGALQRIVAGYWKAEDKLIDLVRSKSFQTMLLRVAMIIVVKKVMEYLKKTLKKTAMKVWCQQNEKAAEEFLKAAGWDEEEVKTMMKLDDDEIRCNDCQGHGLSFQDGLMRYFGNRGDGKSYCTTCWKKEKVITFRNVPAQQLQGSNSLL